MNILSWEKRKNILSLSTLNRAKVSISFYLPIQSAFKLCENSELFLFAPTE